MNKSEQIEELLDQLQSTTGIRFAVTDAQVDEDEALIVLKKMLRAQHNGTSRDAFLRSLILGLLDEQEITDGIHRFHLERNGCYFLVLLESRQPFSALEQSVFVTFFSSGADTLIMTDESHLAVLRQLNATPTDDALRQMIYDMAGTLEAEAMIPLRIAYDRAVTSLDDLPEVFSRISTALSIGSTFSATEHIYWTHDLGMGKLIYELPEKTCVEYLEDHFRGLCLSDLDDETLHTIYTFLDSGLSIAECARKLFLHRNTLIYRLDKIEQLTGLDIRRFDDAMVCRTALMLLTYLDADKN